MADQHSTDTFVLFTDGGSRGNPGPAAAGVVLTDADGRTIYAAGHFLGKATNNVAEYRGLLLGIAEAVDRGVRRLKVRSDSELMVRQINGQYKVKSPFLKELYAEALERIEQLEQFGIVHISRQSNLQADQLVNDALDRRMNVGDAATEGALPWPPDRFTAECTADGCEACPAVVSAGGQWRFDGATPAGLCVHAAAGILAAVTAARPGSKTVGARCVKPGCKAAFDVRIDQE